jgi:hypothetical protein
MPPPLLFFFLRRTPQIYYQTRQYNTPPKKPKITDGSLEKPPPATSDAEQGRAAASPPPLPPGASKLVSGDIHADGKSSLSVSSYQHDGEEGERGTTRSILSPAGEREEDPESLHLQSRTPRFHGEDGANLVVAEREPGDQNSKAWSPPPAQGPRTETIQAEESADPRPPEVARATTRSRRTPSQEGKHADTTLLTASTTTSMTPSAGTLTNPTLYTGRDPGFPHPPAAGAAGGGGENPRLTGERGEETGSPRNRLSLLFTRKGKVTSS